MRIRAEEIQTHQYDDDAGRDAEFRLPDAQETADRRCACAKRDEDRR